MLIDHDPNNNIYYIENIFKIFRILFFKIK